MSEQLNRNAVSAVLAGMSDLMPRIEAIYKDVHAHPELSMQERRTQASPPKCSRKLGPR